MALAFVYKFIICMTILGALDTPAMASSIPCDPDMLVCIDSVEDSQEVGFYLHSNSNLPLTVAFSVKADGVAHSQPLTQHLTILNSFSEKKILTLQVTSPHNWGFQWSYHYHYGLQTAHHDQSYIYKLPFRSGQKVNVAQGYNGEFSHYGPVKYSIDFAAPAGTPVLAARNGRVIATRANSVVSGITGDFGGHENFVWIQHRDGTVGQYVHFQPNGVVAKEGQTVQVGDLLGYLGCTGLCKAPHLHFQVSTSLQEKDDKNFDAFKTFPTLFYTTNGSRLLGEKEDIVVP